MIKEDRAIKILYSYLPKDEPMNAEDREAFFIAIEALKQKSILDKIRERVELEKLGYSPSAGYYKAIMKVLQIIDKCNTEYIR